MPKIYHWRWLTSTEGNGALRLQRFIPQDMSTQVNAVTVLLFTKCELIENMKWVTEGFSDREVKFHTKIHIEKVSWWRSNLATLDCLPWSNSLRNETNLILITYTQSIKHKTLCQSEFSNNGITAKSIIVSYNQSLTAQHVGQLFSVSHECLRGNHQLDQTVDSNATETTRNLPRARYLSFWVKTTMMIPNTSDWASIQHAENLDTKSMPSEYMNIRDGYD